MGNKRVRLKDDEYAILQKYRAIKKQSEAMGLDPKSTHSGWLKTKEASLYFVNPDFGDSIDPEKIRKEFIDAATKHAPEYKPIQREKTLGGFLLSMNISDLHIGKLSVEAGTREKYNVKMAIKRAREAVGSLISTASGYDIDTIILPIGNDILHVDGSKSATTKGTPQDLDGTWHDNFVAARKMYVEIIESLLPIAHVHVVHVPSNHDYASGFFLADAVSCWFSKCPDITFDIDMNHRKYYTYGKNLIGYSHGDGAKMEHLPLIMSNEAKAAWAQTDFRYYYLGHVHHKNVYKFQSGKDYHGVTVEYMRSPSAADQWHADNGYQHVKRAIEAFVHCKDNGQVARLTYHT